MATWEWNKYIHSDIQRCQSDRIKVEMRQTYNGTNEISDPSMTKFPVYYQPDLKLKVKKTLDWVLPLASDESKLKNNSCW